MSDKRVFRLVHEEARSRAKLAVMDAPEGYFVTVSEPTKSRDQEARYHAMFSDVARSCQFMGEKRDAETWKRLLVDAFARVKAAEGDPIKGQGQIIPSLDGSGFVQLGIQTRRLSKKHASEFIEYLYAWGSEQGVRWSEFVSRLAA